MIEHGMEITSLISKTRKIRKDLQFFKKKKKKKKGSSPEAQWVKDLVLSLQRLGLLLWHGFDP